jgi:hypothetical protein
MGDQRNCVGVETNGVLIMPTMAFHTELSKKSVNIGTIADRIARRPQLLLEVFEGLSADQARVKYGCLKLLRLMSERQPAVLYPEFDRFVALLDSENNILKWGAIIVIGNLAVVDSRKKIDRMLDRYLSPITGPVLITAANIVGGAARIAMAKPYLSDKVARGLMQVEVANYQTAECRNVALGKVVESLARFFDRVKDRRRVLAFVERQLDNRRATVRRKAAAFLKGFGKGRFTKLSERR